MGTTIYAGVAVGSHVAGTLASASFAATAVTPAGTAIDETLPTDWQTADIGAVGAAGTATGSLTTLLVKGAGADIWGSADAFRFVYTPLAGDGAIVTQVTSNENVNAWTKAGVMMRETLAADARQAAMIVSPGKGLAFQRRPTTGGESVSTAAGAGSAPYFVKLTRAGATFTAYTSLDGVVWSTVGTATIAMPDTIYVGVAVSSHVAGRLAAATFGATALTQAPAAAPAAPVTSAPPVAGVPMAPSDTDGGIATAPGTDPDTQPTGTATLRLLHWNAHHGGIGSDGKYDPTRIAALVAQVNPDVVSFNEVDDATQVAAILKSLNAKTSGGWKSYAAWKTVFMTRLTVDASSPCLFDAAKGWKSAHISILVNGRSVNLWSTHLDVDSAKNRTTEAGTMQACASAWPEAHIIAGDFNMQAGSTEYKAMTANYSDAWLTAKALGATTNYAGNCDGCTRNTRIDYVFTSKAQTEVTVKSAAILDSRDAKGVTPSDHKPMLVTFEVN
jgi:endonuclease/exonuclease/phosphatase family metal-dependent hydrolase